MMTVQSIWRSMSSTPDFNIYTQQRRGQWLPNCAVCHSANWPFAKSYYCFYGRAFCARLVFSLHLEILNLVDVRQKWRNAASHLIVCRLKCQRQIWSARLLRLSGCLKMHLNMMISGWLDLFYWRRAKEALLTWWQTRCISKNRRKSLVCISSESQQLWGGWSITSKIRLISERTNRSETKLQTTEIQAETIKVLRAEHKEAFRNRSSSLVSWRMSSRFKMSL